MKKEKIKVYIYTRVSTAMQIDGYSLDAQKSRMKAYAEFNDYEIVGEYEDAGKSGKSIEGRVEFNRMMEDIKSGKDGVSYVLVFKLSRFGRNAADVLSTLQVMQDFVRINKEMGISILLNIHHVELAIEYADRIIGIRAGRIVYDGPSKQVDQAVLNAIYGDDAETEATA